MESYPQYRRRIMPFVRTWRSMVNEGRQVANCRVELRRAARRAARLRKEA